MVGHVLVVDRAFSENTESGFRFFPYLSLWISAFLIYIFGTPGSVLYGSLVFPFFSYIILTLIYKRYLPWGWSISLSSLGILGFSSAPFREFLAGLLMFYKYSYKKKGRIKKKLYDNIFTDISDQNGRTTSPVFSFHPVHTTQTIKL